MRKTWQAINALLNRRRRSSKPINKLKDPQINNSIVDDPSRIPNIINKYFSSVGNNLATKMPQAKYSYMKYLNNSKSPDTSFFFEPVTSHEVKLEILSIPKNKSHGLYSCPTQLLKCSCDIISPVLANLLNKSISLGAYPSKLKMSKIIPIYKADDETDACNYRPISLLSNFNRIFEKIMYNRMKVFIEKHQLLYSSQYGFRQAHSTEHAILDMVETIRTNMEKRLFSCGVFIDLKKAFDTVDHNILLDKLNYYGFRGIVNQWFSSYLTNRTQTTEVNSYISDKEAVTCGVPQGSVLGPLLFLLYVNDIQHCSTKLNFFLFADDTNVLYSHENLKTLELIVNAELNNLCNWLNSNKLTLNIQKTNFVIFHPYQKKLNYLPQISIFDNEKNKNVALEHKNCIKFLGLLIDENLSWKNHIHTLTTKISKTVGLLAKVRHILPKRTLLDMYKSLIAPYITYGLTSWGNASKTLLNKVLVLQKRALRLIHFAQAREHAIPLFLKGNLLPLEFLCYEKIANLMYDINTNSAPINILNLFSKITSVHSYSTRSSTSKHYFTKQSVLNIQSKAFSRVGVKIWNGIPTSLKNLSKNSFKKIIRTKLIEILEIENCYAEIDTIINKMKD